MPMGKKLHDSVSASALSEINNSALEAAAAFSDASPDAPVQSGSSGSAGSASERPSSNEDRKDESALADDEQETDAPLDGADRDKDSAPPHDERECPPTPELAANTEAGAWQGDEEVGEAEEESGVAEAGGHGETGGGGGEGDAGDAGDEGAAAGDEGAAAGAIMGAAGSEEAEAMVEAEEADAEPKLPEEDGEEEEDDDDDFDEMMLAAPAPMEDAHMEEAGVADAAPSQPSPPSEAPPSDDALDSSYEPSAADGVSSYQPTQHDESLESPLEEAAPAPPPKPKRGRGFAAPRQAKGFAAPKATAAAAVASSPTAASGPTAPTEPAVDKAKPKTKPRKHVVESSPEDDESMAPPAADAAAADMEDTVAEEVVAATVDDEEEADAEGDEAEEEPEEEEEAPSAKTPKGGKNKGGKSKAGGKSGGGDHGGGGATGSGKAAATSKKAPRDPKKPKKPMAAYGFWCAEARATPEFSDLAFADQSKALGAAWKELGAADKLPFEREAKQARKAYDAKMAQYVPPPGTGPTKSIAKKGASSAKPSKSKAKSATPAVTPKKAPKKASKKRSCRHRDDEQEEADEEAGALEAIGSDAASEEEPTKSEDEDDGMGGCDGTMVPSTPSSRAASRALVAGGKIPRPQSLPMLEGDEHFEPRALAPMRTETWAAGVEVAWVPQGLAALLEAHGEALRSDDDVVARLDEALPVPGSALLARPADGTANAAIVEGVTNIGGGVTLLTLRSTSTLGATADGEDDDDGEEGAAGRLVLPVIDRLHCNVDQYVVKLPLYRASLARVRPSMHVAVPFAEDEGAANLSRPKEVLWEGRVFDPEYVADPEYPTSKYKCLHVAWYRQLKQTPTANQLGDGWVFDDEQTDNFQSPWDTLPSAMHGTWRSFNPKLAKQLQLRPRRGVIKPNALEAVPESMEVDANAEDERELITSVLKRLLSNEATQFFYYPVPAEETEYHKQIDKPTCLLHITQRLQRDEYASFSEFSGEVDQMISNCLQVADDTSPAWILGCMMQKDFEDAKKEMADKGHAEKLLM